MKFANIIKDVSLWRSVLQRIDARHQLSATLFSKPYSRPLYPHAGTVDEFLHIRSITKQVLYFKSWHRLEYKYLKFLWFCLLLSLCKLMIITGTLCCEVYLWKTSLQTDKQKKMSNNGRHTCTCISPAQRSSQLILSLQEYVSATCQS